MRPALEQHFTVAQLAEKWGLSPGVVTTLVRDEEDVMRVNIGRVLNRAKKRFHLRIPESVAIRVHENWSRRQGERKLRGGAVE